MNIYMYTSSKRVRTLRYNACFSGASGRTWKGKLTSYIFKNINVYISIYI